MGDSNTQTSAFRQTITENLTLAEVQSIRADFAAAIAENVNLLDNSSVISWIKIIDAQTANWATINNAQTTTWTNIGNSQ
jgi:hypothetical protein